MRIKESPMMLICFGRGNKFNFKFITSPKCYRTSQNESHMTYRRAWRGGPDKRVTCDLFLAIPYFVEKIEQAPFLLEDGARTMIQKRLHPLGIIRVL